MTSFDSNIAVYAANGASPWHEAAKQFLLSLALRKDVAVCELVLVGTQSPAFCGQRWLPGFFLSLL
ncbi:MAG: hypothetical protein WCK17_16480 [Verrucomicrobiota bacterium]